MDGYDGLAPQKVQKGLGISSILSRYKKRKLQKDGQRWKREVLQGEEGLLLLLMFAEKKSEGRSVEVENMWIGKLFHYEGILWQFLKLVLGRISF